MLKIIHSSFQLDLSNYDISIVEENHWFSDTFFTKFTLPFTFYITDELNAAIGDLLSHNSNDWETYFEVYFYHNGKEHEAIFEIEEFTGREGSGVVRFGLEELPNYNKKLSELPLDDFALEAPATIYTHAETVITKTWPEVSHNFVMVHTDKFDAAEDQWQAFEGVINKRVGSAFVVNEYDAVEDLQLNRNIMMPQPYLLYVLQKAVEDAGFTLAGDVLEDVELKKALFSEISSYYHTINVDSTELKMHSGEQYGFKGHDGKYKKSIILTEKGRYKIAGNLTIRRYYSIAWDKITLNGKRIWLTIKEGIVFSYKEYTRFVDMNIDFFEGDEAIIEYTSEQYPGAIIDGEFVPDQPICDLSITQLSKLDASGNLLPTLVLPNEVKLAKCVPDMTVDEFITILKNWKNLDLVPEGNIMYFNYIESQIDITDAKDLSSYEEKTPRRLPGRGKSFLLKFSDVTSEDYTFEKVFVDLNGVTTNGIETNEDTSEIVIDAIPLPIINRGNIITAHHFLDEGSKLKVILYEGEIGKINASETPFELLIPQVYDKHFLKWFNFRLTGQNYEWSFKMYEEIMRNLDIRNKVFAYKNYHIIKSMTKDLVKPGVWLIQLNTESLKQTVE
ncbi:hypothetical protein CJ739_55 [Mariniflexile rhizosphaerae]|uniref:hypothetical protein n=1 Tax=unclassified Mariniflexile TaxID=2643887 RepID=UPI000E337D63|nr:hypothetical protein [Mariniflexile sp. TRM1-10]AXP79155.1 hypothetical protein CJ739_55 [Mariniflexile sp. TRM1-10]